MTENTTTNPLRVCSFESRRSEETRTLITKMGGVATVVPSMKEVPLTENEHGLKFAKQIFAGEIDYVVFMTGVGTRQLFNVIETKWPLTEFLTELQKYVVISRGPKPVKVLKEEKVRIDFVAPEPNTWHELLETMQAGLDLKDKVIAVQEYGIPSTEFYQELAGLGAEVRSVPVYSWAFPDDPAPLYKSIHQTIAGEFDVLAFTSANQATHVFQAAHEQEVFDEWLAAAQKLVIASIGPTATEHLTKLNLPPQLEASPPKLGPFIRTIMTEGPALVNR
ncbi:bifunctional uroporphyrinogen-III synthetase/response regulator domain protein [Polystyrenella longa]|uniref:Bifunctional uroporphyrinogen-III synthetase/response regulator domain protein n=1 Tax=Polystyrenella longa TaxID=2528007 RepID=A0A518CUB9_9PLAN|nr:uroporphyrinogen-III synthase [Polystyrenella longa]QDU82805.1 bifunctional uroporphyrinogen-III synthetase/response regulator domain protein [Polystyrenella longa]